MTVNDDSGLAEPIPKSASGIVNYVLTSLPLRVVHYLRDIGIINMLNDVLVVLIGIGLIGTKPKLISSFLSLSSRMRTINYGTKPFHTLEVIDPVPRNDICNDTCCIFIHGGAWGSGKPWMYRLIADGMSRFLECDQSFIVIGYPVYPYGNIYEQSQCIYDAIKYINNHENEIFQKKDINLVLCGHSSGANIGALAIMNSIRNRDESKLVDSFVGLAGVYDIMKHYYWEKSRGVHEISPMKPAGLGVDNFHKCSPTQLLQQNMTTIFKNNELKDERFDEEQVRRLFPSTLLLHGTLDHVVPFTSSKEFAIELDRKGVNCDIVYFQGDHGEPILDMMQSDNTVFKTSLRNAWNRHKKMNIC